MYLTDKQRKTIRYARTLEKLTQREAGMKAWPNISETSARQNWTRLENQHHNVTIPVLEAALQAVGLRMEINLVSVAAPPRKRRRTQTAKPA